MKLFFVYWLASMLAVAAPINGPVKVTLINTGDGTSDGRDFIGPYTLQIDAKSYPAMCIDFLDDTAVGASWTADFTDLSSKNFSGTYLGNGNNTVKIYDEEADLFAMLLDTTNAMQRTNIQHAAWYLTDHAYSLNSGAKQELKLAEDTYDSKAFQKTVDDYEIVSDVDMGAGQAQEFIIRIATPEPRSLALIGAGLLLITWLLRKVLLKKEIARR